MAKSGSFTVSAGGRTSTISWSVGKPNYSGNYYPLTVKRTTTGGSVSSAYLSVYHYATSTSNPTVIVSMYKGASYSSTSLRVPSGGTISFSVDITVGSHYNSVNKDYAVDVIDRSSVPTLSATSVTLDGSVTLTTNRKVSSFTHKITGGFSTSSLTDTLATNVGDSTTLNFPVETFASKITNSSSAQYIIRTTTYSGSTSLGYKDKTITLNVPESYVDPDTGQTVTIAPKLSDLIISDIGDVLYDLGKYYNNRSRLSASCTETLSFSSPIKSRTLTFNGVSKTSATSPVNMDNTISVDSSTLPKTYTVELTVTDGRGRSASISGSIDVQNYSLDVSGIDIYRSDANGNNDSEGTYITVTGTYTKTSIKDGSGNEQNFVRRLIYVDDQLVWQSGDVRQSDADNTTVILPTSGSGIYDINTSYQVTVGYGDAVTSYVVKGEATIPTALRPISINADGSAIAFGKPALNTDKGMYIYYDPVYIYGKLVASHIGQIIMSTTLDTEAKVIAEYGGEKWVQHSGYMLRGASSGVTASTENDLHNTADGGAEEVKLTVDQIPSHNHGSSGGITNGITGGSHAHTYEYKGEAASKLSGSNPTDFGNVYRRKSPSDQTGLSTASATHTHSLPNHTHSSVGGDKAHNNMPPYKDVYIWERIA